MPRIPQKDDSVIVLDHALSVQFEGYFLYPDYLKWMQATVDKMIADYPHLSDGEHVEIVAEQILESRPVSTKIWLWRAVPKDAGFIDHLLETFRNPPCNSYPYPKGLRFRSNWQVFPCVKDKDLKSNRVSAKDSGSMPVFDISKVPAKYEFMLTTAFKDQAQQFYKELSFVNGNSDVRWIQKYFVDRLDRFSHIKRADDAMDGMISKVMSAVADNLRSVPNWWSSFSISLMRGDGVAASEACMRVLADVEKTGGANKPLIDENDEFGSDKMGVQN